MALSDDQIKKISQKAATEQRAGRDERAIKIIHAGGRAVDKAEVKDQQNKE